MGAKAPQQASIDPLAPNSLPPGGSVKDLASQPAWPVRMYEGVLVGDSGGRQVVVVDPSFPLIAQMLTTVSCLTFMS